MSLFLPIVVIVGCGVAWVVRVGSVTGTMANYESRSKDRNPNPNPNLNSNPNPDPNPTFLSAYLTLTLVLTAVTHTGY